VTEQANGVVCKTIVAGSVTLTVLQFIIMAKLVTSKQINDATQTRFFPAKRLGEIAVRGKRKPDLPDDRPPVYAVFLIPFILLLIKLCDLYDWITSRKNK